MRYPLLCAAVLASTSACIDDPTVTTKPLPDAPAAAVGTDPLSKINRLSPSLEQKVGLFRADLEAKGYQVARGYWTLWGVEDCKYPIQTVGFCYGNNPTAPYVVAVVPSWKDEFVEQRMHHSVSAFRRDMSAVYRLDPKEALVVMAELPPPAKYFGIQTNVFTREVAVNTNDQVYIKPMLDDMMRGILFGASPDPSRQMMVASIGDATNNVVIANQSGQAWQAGQQRFFVITADASIADSMTAALLRAGVPSVNVFNERVASALVRVGLGRSADELITYIRYAMPDDILAGEQWRSRLPLTVLRVRYMGNAITPSPFAIPAYEQRHWNYDETVLNEDLDSLVSAVRTYWNQPAAPLLQAFSAYLFLDLVGQHCLGYPNAARGPMNCLGDTQDTDYQISQSLYIDEGQVIALMGTLGTETGNATYVSLSVNWFPELVGLANISHDDLKGTAAPFANALQHDDRLFYVYYMARDCTGLENCVAIPKKSVPVGEIIKTIQRNYVTPGYRRGPDPTKLVNPVALVLDGRYRPSPE